jgi:hypothetical protein
MMKLHLLICVTVLMVITLPGTFGDGGGVNPPSIGISSANGQPPVTMPSPVQIETSDPNTWIGRNFVLLRREKDSFCSNVESDDPAHDGLYDDFAVSKPTATDHENYEGEFSYDPGDGAPVSHLPGLKYDKFVGRTIECKACDGDNITFYVPDFNIHIQTANTYARFEGDSVSDIAPAQELDEAKAKWLAKTVYLNSDAYLMIWNNKTQTETELTTFDGFDIDANLNEYYVPLKVSEIIWGDKNWCPLWFIVETKSGQRIGFGEGCVENINTAVSSGINGDAISSIFTLKSDYDAVIKDRQSYHWSHKIWMEIDQKVVRIGMTSQQVEMSIGSPTKINTDTYADGIHEQWIYKSKYVYLENGIVTAIQDRP